MVALLLVAHLAHDLDPGHLLELGGLLAEIHGHGVGPCVGGAALDEHAEDAQAVAFGVVHLFRQHLGDRFDHLAGEHLLHLDVAAGVVELGDFEDEIAVLALRHLGLEVFKREGAVALRFLRGFGEIFLVHLLGPVGHGSAGGGDSGRRRVVGLGGGRGCARIRLGRGRFRRGGLGGLHFVSQRELVGAGTGAVVGGVEVLVQDGVGAELVRRAHGGQGQRHGENENGREASDPASFLQNAVGVVVLRVIMRMIVRVRMPVVLTAAALFGVVGVFMPVIVAAAAVFVLMLVPVTVVMAVIVTAAAFLERMSMIMTAGAVVGMIVVVAAAGTLVLGVS